MEVKIIGKPNCPYCERAKHLLDIEGVEYVYLDASKDESLRQELIAHGYRTVPVIFLMNGDEQTYMGGYKELSDYFRQKHEEDTHASE